MRLAPLLGLALIALTGACTHQRPLVADVGVRTTVTDVGSGADTVSPAKVRRAAAEVVALHAQRFGCPAVRVRRADSLVRGDGTPWLVVRLQACGEERVYERTELGWSEATARLR